MADQPTPRVCLALVWHMHQPHYENPLTGQFGRGLADANGLTNLDVIVGLRPGAAVNTIGNCYLVPDRNTINHILINML